MKWLKSSHQSTWQLPVIIAVSTLVGLIGSLIYDGLSDFLFTLILALAILSIALSWQKPS